MSETEMVSQEPSVQPQETEAVNTNVESVDTPQEVTTQEPEQVSEVEANTDTQPTTEENSEVKEPVQEETFLGTYKTKEAAEKGIKDKDEYIEKLKADLQAKQAQEQEVYKQLGYQNQQQFQNAQVEHQLQGQYQNELAYVEQAYNTDLITLNNALDNGQLSEFDYNQQVQRLQQLKVDYLAGVKANDMTRRQQAQYQAQTAQQQAFEQQKNALYETHKEHKELIDLFYDPQPTIEKALAYENVVAQKAVEAYKKSLQAGQESADAKAGLTSSAQGTSTPTDTSMPQSIKAVLARAEKDPQWYNSNSVRIAEMINSGVIK